MQRVLILELVRIDWGLTYVYTVHTRLWKLRSRAAKQLLGPFQLHQLKLLAHNLEF